MATADNLECKRIEWIRLVWATEINTWNIEWIRLVWATGINLGNVG